MLERGSWLINARPSDWKFHIAPELVYPPRLEERGGLRRIFSGEPSRHRLRVAVGVADHHCSGVVLPVNYRVEVLLTDGSPIGSPRFYEEDGIGRPRHILQQLYRALDYRPPFLYCVEIVQLRKSLRLGLAGRGHWSGRR